MGLVFGYDGVQAKKLIEHFKSWATAPDAPPRKQWPDRIYNMQQKLLVFPEKTQPDGTASPDSPFAIAGADDPVVRFFLTQTLAKLGLTNLQPFMRADKTGKVIATI